MTRMLGASSLALVLVAASCGSKEDPAPPTTVYVEASYVPFADGLPEAGTASPRCLVPTQALAADVSSPDHVIGDGTPASCTSAAVVAAIALGGVITFDCGPDPITIVLQQTAKIFNDTGPDIVIDGGSKVTLSGGGARRILYMNTCDEAQHWTTSHCQDQDHPRLTVQNLSFVDGDSRAETTYDGGGAIYARGGRFRAINCRFFRNRCADTGPDVGGAGLRVFDQSLDGPALVVHSTFGGATAQANVCSNGGALSSIGVSWSIFNSVLSDNRAIGNGGNPAEPGTPGGGSGGAIYNDGNTLRLYLCGDELERNEVNAYGAGIFFVSNNHDGIIQISRSTIRANVNHGGSTWEILPGISGHLDTTMIVDAESVIE
ncbi:MAG TPA: hypothetical protein VLT61_16950 [Anaeromyxobacteraceae bacterium]|nr:hypothetical protein [Anaeromyxobacteraceae bacterium]